MLWAVLWIGIGLATIPMVDKSTFLEDLIDDDGDNVVPRMWVTFWCVLVTGAIGSLCAIRLNGPRKRLYSGCRMRRDSSDDAGLAQITACY